MHRTIYNGMPYVEMAQGRCEKEYNCPYCGQHFRDRTWTFEHVIPRDIGGPKLFKIIACHGCNNRLGRGIEQDALRSNSVRRVYCDRIRDGYKIGSRRRKKGSYPLHKGYGESGGRKVRLMRNLETGDLELQFLDAKGPPNPRIRQAIVPVPENEFPDPLLRMVNKIVLGAMVWLWGDEIALTEGARSLRNRIWNRTDENTLVTLGCEERHMSMRRIDATSCRAPVECVGDALDNRPNHTICFLRDEDIVFSIVNLFGELESMVFIVDSAISERIPRDDPVVLIAMTTENSVVKMSLSEYADRKASVVGGLVTFNCEIPVQREQIDGVRRTE